MKTFLHLVGRELADRRFFSLFALALGFLPLLLAPIAAKGAGGLPMARAFLAQVTVLGVLFGAALALGGRWPLAGFADGRRSFELARPVGSWQLCSSKLAAGLTVAFLAACLAGLPAAFGGLPAEGLFAWLEVFREKHGELLRQVFSFMLLREKHPHVLTDWVPGLDLLAAGAALGTLGLFTLAPALSFAFGGRGRRQLADLASWILFGGLLYFAFSRLARLGAEGIGFAWLIPLVLLLTGLGIASAWRSFAAGPLRDDAHRAYSRTMNRGLLALGVMAAGAGVAATPLDPNRLTGFFGSVPSADGSQWLVFNTLHERKFAPVFLVETATGKWQYLMPQRQIPYQPWLSRDGSRVFGYLPSGTFFGGYAISGGKVEPLPELVQADWRSPAMAIDPRGELLVTLSQSGELKAHHLTAGAAASGRGAEGPKKIVSSAVVGKSLVIHREGSLFDLLVHRQDQSGKEERWTVQRFLFDAATGRLEPGESAAYPPCVPPQGPDWWREAIRLERAGVPLADLLPLPRLLSLEGGLRLEMAQPASQADRSKTWIVVDPRKNHLGTFTTGRMEHPVGEIRPSLLLASRPRLNKAKAGPDNPDDSVWETRVIGLPSGKELRRLEGFRAIKDPSGVSRRVWLIDDRGEPYDLPDADAEPQRILPVRPRGKIFF